jgi:hypothetical protein
MGTEVGVEGDLRMQALGKRSLRWVFGGIPHGGRTERKRKKEKLLINMEFMELTSASPPLSHRHIELLRGRDPPLPVIIPTEIYPFPGVGTTVNRQTEVV